MEPPPRRGRGVLVVRFPRPGCAPPETGAAPGGEGERGAGPPVPSPLGGSRGTAHPNSITPRTVSWCSLPPSVTPGYHLVTPAPSPSGHPGPRGSCCGDRWCRESHPSSLCSLARRLVGFSPSGFPPCCFPGKGNLRRNENGTKPKWMLMLALDCSFPALPGPPATASPSTEPALAMGDSVLGVPWHPGTADLTRGTQNQDPCCAHPRHQHSLASPHLSSDCSGTHTKHQPLTPWPQHLPGTLHPRTTMGRGTPQPPAAPWSSYRIKASVSKGKTMCRCVRSANKVMFCLCPPSLPPGMHHLTPC